jgi:hypothetical protein
VSNIRRTGGSERVLELLIHQPIFIGFKVDSSLRQHLESLNGNDRKYIAGDDSSFLRTCRAGEDLYVGKLVHDSLTTDRVDDIRRNVLSILRKLGHTVRLPNHLRILGCRAVEAESSVAPVRLVAP